ncbi:MAG: carbon-nitrogen hydrolase family protein, partial [Fusobacterium sp. JB020]|nr:carbon-nitrogen hydrolase family protein [Fusobacterium sp. JB020]
MKVALIQMKVLEKKDDNMKKAALKIKEAASKNVDLVMLPEMFNCPYETKNFPIYAEEENGKSDRFLASLAKKYKVYLIAGSMPERENGKIYNTSYIYSPEGLKIGKHRKIHLFDIDVQGGQKFKESDTLTKGETPTIFQTKFGKMGVMICFDIRFQELTSLMAKEGAKVIFVPAAFNMTTGPAHWETLFKGRALDNQIFMVGTAPARDEKSSYCSYGHSIVTSPWG